MNGINKAWDAKEDRRMNPHSCNPDTCQYHYLTESVIGDLKDAVGKLLEGQREMSTTIIQLTEAFKAVDKIEAKIEKMEAKRDEINKIQDEKIYELRKFMWKIVGAFTGGALLVPYIIEILMKKV